MAYRVCGSCGTKNHGSSNECSGCGEPFRQSPAQAGAVDHAGRRFLDVAGAPVSVSCSWNDHGALCREYGVNTDATNGFGPFYCRPHYRKHMGWDT